MSVIYPQNGDLTKLLKSAQKKVPQSARLSAGEGGAQPKRAMPKCLQHEFEGGFPNLMIKSDTGSIPAMFLQNERQRKKFDSIGRET